MQEKKLQPVEYVIIGLMIIAGLLTIWRCFYTVDLTDESYIYADALATIKGNIPYAHNFTEGAGMSFITMVFLWVYMRIVPSLAGVVLYLRLCFATLRLFEVYVIYKLLRKKHDRMPVLLGCSILVVWHYFSNYFSYNTIPVFLILLVGVVFYVNVDSDRTKKTYLTFGIMGVLSALSAFANPFFAVSVVEIIIALFVLSPKNKKIKTVLSYCAGGIIQGLVVFIGICAQVGYRAFFHGLKCMIVVGSQQNTFNRASRLRKYFDRYWLLFVMILVAFLIGLLIEKIRKETSCTFAIELSLLAGFVFMLFNSGWCTDIWKVGGHIGTAVSYIAIVMYVRKRYTMFWFTGVPLITITFLELLCSKGGFAGIHSSFAVPALVGMIIELYEDGDKVDRILNNIVTFLIFASLLFADVIYVYRDESLASLHTKVLAGVYKGIITTEQNAKCLPEMEDYLRTTISPDEYIAFRDCVPFAYLMFEAKCCDLKTWDPLDYSYGKNTDPAIVLKYFENKGHIPDEMIYIDFGRDANLSAEDEEWRFNEWLNSYYVYDDELQLNEKFRVLRYKNVIGE